MQALTGTQQKELSDYVRAAAAHVAALATRRVARDRGCLPGRRPAVRSGTRTVRRAPRARRRTPSLVQRGPAAMVGSRHVRPELDHCGVAGGDGRGGVTTAMLSVTMPGIWKSGDVAGSVRLARLCNEQMTGPHAIMQVATASSRRAVAADRREPRGDPVCARRAARRCDRAALELRQPVPGRPTLRAGIRGARPAPRRGVRASDGARVLHDAGTGCRPGTLEAPTDTARTVESLLVSGTLSRLSASSS